MSDRLHDSGAGGGAERQEKQVLMSGKAFYAWRKMAATSSVLLGGNLTTLVNDNTACKRETARYMYVVWCMQACWLAMLSSL